MARLSAVGTRDDAGFSAAREHGTYIRGIGRQVFARNWRGDWVCQVMHNFSVPVGPDDDLKRARFVDEVLRRRNAKKA